MSTELRDVMQKIEDHRFSAEVNLAAGSKAFRRNLQNHEMFRALVELMKEPGATEAIAKRVADLSARPTDLQYENSFDAALSAYLTALGETATPDLIAEAASAAARACNCWWTTAISRDLLVHALATGVVGQPRVAQSPLAPTPPVMREGLGTQDLKVVNWF